MMMRLVLVVSCLMFAFPSFGSAQNVNMDFPTDIVGFRFGADMQEIQSHCLRGAVVETSYVCFSPRRELGFDAEVHIMFSLAGRADTIIIQTDPANSYRGAENIFLNLQEQLNDEFGNPDISDPIEDHSTVNSWVFVEPHRFCRITLGLYTNRSNVGNMMLIFSAINI